MLDGAFSAGSGAALPSFLSPRLLQPLDVDSLPLWEYQMESWSLLARVVHTIEDLLLSCNKACLVCDSALDFVAIRPSICNAELCLVGADDRPLLCSSLR
jgi:hypothetical protein